MSEAPSRVQASLRGLCPRCGAPGLFSGWIQVAPRCRQCGLDFLEFNVGDGAAAFLILIVGALVCFLAVMTELKLGPPWWVHLLWLPVTIGLTVGGLRLAKGLIMFQIFHHRAGEGRRVE